jgi:pilus assembly protein Flp/PilA
MMQENLKKGETNMLFAPKENEKGQGLVEYALILVLVAIVVIAVLMLLGPIIGNVFSTINDSLSGV